MSSSYDEIREGVGIARLRRGIFRMEGADRLDLLRRSAGLTVRETELLQVVATGADTRAIARQMFLEIWFKEFGRNKRGTSRTKRHNDVDRFSGKVAILRNDRGYA